MQYQNETNKSRYDQTSANMRNSAKLFETATTGFGSTKNSSFRLRKTHSFTSSNVKAKLEVFEGVLQNLTEELAMLRNDTHESLRYCSAITQQLPLKLSTNNANMRQRVKELTSTIDVLKKNEQDRIMAIRNRCGELYDRNMDIKSRFQGLRFRLEETERVMGFYGAPEKYRS